jgi:hypothetical protein
MSSRCLHGFLVLALGAACMPEKRAPTDRDFVANPPTAEPSRAARAAVPDRDSTHEGARSAPPSREEPRAGRQEPAPARPPAPPPPPAAVRAPAPEVASIDDAGGNGAGDVYFDDDFSRGNACAKGQSRRGFGWAEVQSKDADSVSAVQDPDSPSGCALAFVFAGNPDPADDAWAEQRFRVGRVEGEPAREIFIGFVVKVPSNYNHRDAKGPDNNKLLRLWDERYRPSVVHLGMSALRKPDGRGSQLSVEYMEGRKTDNFNKGPWNIILTPGRVDTVGFYVRIPSSMNGSDGAIKIWWNRQLKLNLTGLRLANPTKDGKGYNGIGNGYLFGWANSGFTERTELHVWRFIIAGKPVEWFMQ